MPPVQAASEENAQKKKKHVKKGSFDAAGGNGEKPIANLLNEDDDLNGTVAAGQPTNPQRQSKRGPKIDENVMVKICDMGNGCWTYHHFTPEI